MGKRWKVKWISQNTVEVDDTREDDLFYMNGDVEVLKRFEELPDEQAELFFEGFLAGVEYCDGQLKHCFHNFINQE